MCPKASVVEGGFVPKDDLGDTGTTQVEDGSSLELHPLPRS